MPWGFLQGHSFETKAEALADARKLRKLTERKVRVIRSGTVRPGARPFIVQVEYERKYTS